MVDDRQAKRARVGQGVPEQRPGSYGCPVVAETGDAGIGQLAERGQGLSGAAGRDQAI